MKIETVGDQAEAALAEITLRKLLSEYDLERFMLTRHIRIQPGVIPHSHPVLTLDTEFAGQPERFLAALLHEQMHWLVSKNESGMYRAVADFIDRYPDVPVGGTESAHNRFSVYLHFIVNWLELQALATCVGETQARGILATLPYYRWIYAKLLEDEDDIAEINRRHGFVLPE